MPSLVETVHVGVDATQTSLTGPSQASQTSEISIPIAYEPGFESVEHSDVVASLPDSAENSQPGPSSPAVDGGHEEPSAEVAADWTDLGAGDAAAG